MILLIVNDAHVIEFSCNNHVILHDFRLHEIDYMILNTCFFFRVTCFFSETSGKHCLGRKPSEMKS